MPDLKQDQRKIDIKEMPVEIPDFTSTYEPKEFVIKKWIINWIKSAISNKTIKENDIMPKKSDISNHLGVSIGTVQNAIRYVEDEGFLKSKQKLGTMISNVSNPISSQLKSTSKRDLAVLAIKKTIIQQNIKVGKAVFSTRKMSEFIGLSQNTTRLAYEYLCSIGILTSRKIRGNDSNWYLTKVPVISDDGLKVLENMSTDSLVDKVITDLKTFLSKNFKIGDKIPSQEELAEMLNVSVKTVNDAVQELNKLGIVISRRGRYGSILAKDPLSDTYEPLKENSIFAKAQDAEFYCYKKIENSIITLINNNYNSGDKLPSMAELAKKYSVSTNTIRKALMNLEQEGFIMFGRGRYGGTFLVEKPLNDNKQAYQWLSINPDYI